MPSTITGFYRTREEAEAAVRDLVARGVPEGRARLVEQRTEQGGPLGDPEAHGLNIGWGVPPTPEALEAVIEQHASEIDEAELASGLRYVVEVDVTGDSIVDEAARSVLNRTGPYAG